MKFTPDFDDKVIILYYLNKPIRIMCHHRKELQNFYK